MLIRFRTFLWFKHQDFAHYCTTKYENRTCPDFGQVVTVRIPACPVCDCCPKSRYFLFEILILQHFQLLFFLRRQRYFEFHKTDNYKPSYKNLSQQKSIQMSVQNIPLIIRHMHQPGPASSIRRASVLIQQFKFDSARWKFLWARGNKNMQP